ncbi:PREDICTED: lectizyme-like [Papilio xuthus]|uniref:Lectizyme-like n=1 Tax=Papilio xuthus TaxID=66420 RepID=A0AAJ6ZWE6_PAPXU|nr:PREDICTED: lectizyme-like [Papilio xuthus]
MGAGQIGGISTLLEMDFNNAAGFLGQKADNNEAQFVVYYLSHAMVFCTGVIIEPHVVLTPASCVFGEKYRFDVFAGSHMFLEKSGISRTVNNLCIHQGYNHSLRWKDCQPDNLALLILSEQFSFHQPEEGADYVVNKVRYGSAAPRVETRHRDRSCRLYGWGSRRGGFLVPVLIHLYRLEITLLPSKYCVNLWNYDNRYLCIRQPRCKNDKYGALCPDDIGSVVVCSGFVLGMMTSRLIDRPCGVGFLDLTKYAKFLTCGVDDSRDVIDHEAIMEFDYTTEPLMTLYTVSPGKDKKNSQNETEETTEVP